MTHYQYRIRERVRYNGQKDYVVEWRDDWFGTGIFWLSSWLVDRTRDYSERRFRYFRFAEFNTIEEARAHIEKRKAMDEKRAKGKIATERTVK